MCNFLRIIANAVDKPSWVFMDNASYHRSKGTIKEMRRLKLLPIFNKPYNPAYNPIESVFGVLKTIFRQMRLKAIAENQ